MADRAIRSAEYWEGMQQRWPKSNYGAKAIPYYLEALAHRELRYPGQLLQPGTTIEVIETPDGHHCARIVSVEQHRQNMKAQDLSKWPTIPCIMCGAPIPAARANFSDDGDEGRYCERCRNL
jgi:hypothetical protein